MTDNDMASSVYVKTRESPLNFSGLSRGVAEREGFEPPVPFSTAVFKTAVIDHSTISPVGFGCKDTTK